MGENKENKHFLDSIWSNYDREKTLKVSEKMTKNKPTLFSRGRRTELFFTNDSKIYITPLEYKMIKNGIPCSSSFGSIDGLSARIMADYMKYRPTKAKNRLVNSYLRRYVGLKEDIARAKDQTRSFWQGMTLVRVWNVSMIGAIILGMVSMSFIYRYLSPGVLAEDSHLATTRGAKIASEEKYPQSKVLGTEKTKTSDSVYFENLLNDLLVSRKEEFEQKIRDMVKGYPIEEMAPYIAEKDPIVASFLVSIARKESSWGVHVPVLDGQDCYNYWGYRGIRRLMGTGGHTCFNSRKDAVDTVAKRIEFLVNNKKLNTPEKMVIWKCGSDCSATGGQAAAQKWINDVDYYFKKFNNQS